MTSGQIVAQQDNQDATVEPEVLAPPIRPEMIRIDVRINEGGDMSHDINEEGDLSDDKLSNDHISSAIIPQKKLRRSSAAKRAVAVANATAAGSQRLKMLAITTAASMASVASIRLGFAYSSFWFIPHACLNAAFYPLLPIWIWHMAFPQKLSEGDIWATVRIIIPATMVMNSAFWITSTPHPVITNDLAAGTIVFVIFTWDFVVVIGSPAWRSRVLWWSARQRWLTRIILFAISLAFVAIMAVELDVEPFGTFAFGGVILLGLIIIPIWFASTPSPNHSVTNRTARNEASGAYLLAVVFFTTGFTSVCSILLELVLAQQTFASMGGVLIGWYVFNFFILVTYGHIAAERALSPVRAPPLMFPFILTMDAMLTMIYVDSNVRDPFFWFALVIEVLGNMTRDTGLVDDALTQLVKWLSPLSSRRKVPSQEEMLADWSLELRRNGHIYGKHAKVHAKVATEHCVVKTVVDGIVEAQQQCVKGDFIMAGTRGGVYGMKREKFEVRYKHKTPLPASNASLAQEGFFLFVPQGSVWACELTPPAIDAHFPEGCFTGSWGGRLTVASGDFLAMPFPAGDEIYCIRKRLFMTTYSKTEQRSGRMELLFWEAAAHFSAGAAKKGPRNSLSLTNGQPRKSLASTKIIRGLSALNIEADLLRGEQCDNHGEQFPVFIRRRLRECAARSREMIRQRKRLKIAELSRTSEIVSSASLFAAMLMEDILERYGVGEPSVARGLDATDRFDAMCCFAVVFVFQTMGARATAYVRQRRLRGRTMSDPLGDAAVVMWQDNKHFLCAVAVLTVLDSIKAASFQRLPPT